MNHACASNHSQPARRREPATAGEQAAALFVAVRDEIRFDPYSNSQEAADYRASWVLGGPSNWCVPKAVLLAAAARASGIPCKLGCADVRSHLTTPKLEALMGTDLFLYHGYVEWLVEDSGSKVTPASNRALCAGTSKTTEPSWTCPSTRLSRRSRLFMEVDSSVRPPNAGQNLSK